MKLQLKDRVMKIFIIVPAYNEESRIGEVIADISKYADKVVVVDDCSTDNTVKKVRGKNVVLLRHAVNLGQGAAIQTGFDYAKLSGAEVIVTFDADGQFLASEIPAMIKPIIENKADITLGSRFKGKTINMPLLRKVVLKVGIIFTYIFSGIKLSDTHNGFRALRRNAIDRLEITQNRMAHASEIIDKIAKSGLSYVEVPVTVKYNTDMKKGQTNLNAIRIIASLISKAIT
jgi:polyprenyl-phospho-N-acetylgalactosaminyl synthase